MITYFFVISLLELPLQYDDQRRLNKRRGGFEARPYHNMNLFPPEPKIPPRRVLPLGASSRPRRESPRPCGQNNRPGDISVQNPWP